MKTDSFQLCGRAGDTVGLLAGLTVAMEIFIADSGKNFRQGPVASFLQGCRRLSITFAPVNE